MQPIDIVEGVCPFNQEQEPTRRRASSSELHFEEYPARQKKTDHSITYKLTDGKQINTGYGRALRAFGYVMETSPGRWVARVRDVSSGTLPLIAAKKAAIELHGFKDKVQPRDWIAELDRQMVAEIDRFLVTQTLTDDCHYHVKLRWGDFRAEFPHSEYPEDDAAYQLYDWGFRGTFSMHWSDGGVATFVKATRRPAQSSQAASTDQLGIQGDDYQLNYYPDGYPMLPACLDRRRLFMAEAA